MTQSCDSKCGQCARKWWAWLKSREHQMNMPWSGAEVSFAQAALTSNRPPRPTEPCTCSWPVGDTVKHRDFPGAFEVLYNSGFVGLDGRHWVKVRQAGALVGGEDWTFHTECGTLRSCAPTPCEADF